MQQSFSQLGVSARIVSALAERDITAPFPIQAKVLSDALAGRDILAKAPTGSGKTIAFAIPIVERIEPGDRRPAAVVLVPTRELALQVTGEFEAIAPKGVEIATVYGGVPIHAQAKRARAAHVLVATPGRLNDLLERKAVVLDAVKFLVLDEADRMLDMGFKPQVDRIVRRMPKTRQTMFFSATLDAAVGEVAREYTSSPVRHEAAPIAPENQVEVEHRFVSVKPEDKIETLAGASSERTIAGSHSSSSARAAAQTGSSRSSSSIRSTRLRSTVTWTRTSASTPLKRFESGEASTLVETDVAASRPRSGGHHARRRLRSARRALRICPITSVEPVAPGAAASA